MIKPISLDYAREQTSKYKVLGWSLLVVSFTLAFYLLQTYQALTKEVDALQAQLGQTKNTVQLRVEIFSQELTTEIEENNRVLRKLGLPWNELFNTIESVSTADVAVLSISPDPDQGVVTITAEAEGAANISKYIQQLDKTSALDNVYLVSHQVKTQDPQKPIGFVIAAKWVFSIDSQNK